jgi:hypothetical protein
MWPDWVVVMSDGTLRRVRLISSAPYRCPAGPCGVRNEYVLFSAEVSAKTDLDEVFHE